MRKPKINVMFMDPNEIDNINKDSVCSNAIEVAYRLKCTPPTVYKYIKGWAVTSKEDTLLLNVERIIAFTDGTNTCVLGLVSNTETTREKLERKIEVLNNKAESHYRLYQKYTEMIKELQQKLEEMEKVNE